MANQLSKFVEDLAIQAKFDIESDDWKTFIDKIKETDTPEGFGDSFHQAFMTIDSAKNNGEVNNHFKAKHLSAVDNVISKALKTLEVDETKLAEYNAETDSLKKTKMALTIFEEVKTAQLEEAGKAASSGTEAQKQATEALNKTITELNGQLSTQKDGFETKLKEQGEAFEQKSLQSTISEMIGSYDLATSDIYTSDDIKTLVAGKISNAPFVFKKSEEGYKTYNKDNPEMEYFEDNKPVLMKDAIEKIVAPYVKKNQEPAPKPGEKPTIQVVDPGSTNKYKFGAHANHEK